MASSGHGRPGSGRTRRCRRAAALPRVGAAVAAAVALACCWTAVGAVASEAGTAVVDPARGDVSLELCPGSVSVEGKVLALQEKKSGPINPRPPIRTDPNTTGSFQCWYEASPIQVSIDFAYVREPYTGSGQYCSKPPPAPGYLNSTTHQIQVFVNDRIDGAPALRRQLLATAEARSIGSPCVLLRMTQGERDSVAATLKVSWGGAILTCTLWPLATAVAPYFPPAVTAASYLGAGCWTAATTEISSAGVLLLFDPPDSRYARVALPRSLPASASRVPRGGREALCKLVVGAGACRPLQEAARRHVEANAALAAVMEAMFVGANRFHTAGQSHSLAGMALQRAAAKVYAGLVRLSGEYLNATSSRLRSVYPWQRSNPSLTPAQVRRVEQALTRLKGMPTWLIKRFASDGASRSDIVGGVKEAMKVAKLPPGELTLRWVLDQRLPTGPLLQSYESITPTEVGLVLDALRRSGAIRGTLARTLGTQLEAARSAADPTQRRTAMTAFLKTLGNGDTKPFEKALRSAPDAPIRLPVTARDFLWTAAAPLAYR